MSAAHAHARPSREQLRRLLALFVVLALLIGAFVVSALVHRARLRASSLPSAAVSYVEPYGAASSTAWYCPGPLPVGDRYERSSIAIANVASHAVSGEITFALSSGSSTSSSIRVAGGSQAVVGLPRAPHEGDAAATVLVDGSGVGVSAIVSGPFGSTSSPCVDHAVSSEYFASGSTLGSDGISLALYDPGATPAVASVSFATSGGPQAPASFQGVPIAPGSLVVLDVARAVPQQRSVATSVSVTGGRIVAGAVLTAGLDGKLVGSLVTGTPQAEPAWYFGGSPAGGSAKQVFTVYNPTSSATSVGVVFSGSASKASAQLSVPAGATTSFSAPSSNAHGVMSWVKVASKDPSAPIVVGRELLVESALSNHVPIISTTTTCLVKRRPRRCVRAVAATFALPTLLPAGFSAPAALPALARRWLIPGGTSDQAMSEMLTVTNPGRKPARVDILGLNGRAYPGLSGLVLAPGGAGALDLGRLLPGVRRSLPLVVSADEPIVVNAGLYRRGGGVAIGFSTFAAIPLK